MNLEALRPAVLRAVSWLFLASAAALLVPLALRLAAWLRARRRAATEPVVVPRVRIRVRTSSAASLHAFDFAPITVASFGSPDLLLSSPSPPRLSLRLDLSGGPEPQLLLTANPPLPMNGVPRKQKWLKPADRIRFGAHLLEFQEVSVRALKHPPPRPPAFGWPASGIAVLLILGALFGAFADRPAEPSPSVASLPPAGAPVAARVAQAEAPPAAVERPSQAASVSVPAGRKAPQAAAPVSAAWASKPPEEQSAGSAATVRKAAAAPRPSAPSAAASSSAAFGKPVLREPRLTGPGETPEYFPADILLFHAHPDDESLAFGVLMAAASRTGKRLAVVLFTDGEAGKDRYPNRPVGGPYPDHALRGARLAEVRVQEARSALGILGCEAYVRLGLKNHPYNRSTDAIPPERVVAEWGGEQELLARLEELLRGYRPRIVVSPEGPGGGRAHFEHQAVGLLAARAVAALRLKGADFLQGHLVPVDPADPGRYPELVEIDADATDPESGLTYRQIQELALRAHVSQRDASVLGCKRLSRFPKEYYRALDWALEVPFPQYLAQPPGREPTGPF